MAILIAMSKNQEIQRHPIRVVALRTGLTPDLLRAWERRYQVVRPSRSNGGQRLYSDRDIERLALLRQATLGGRSISQVADLATSELEALVEGDAQARAATVPPAGAGGGASRPREGGADVSADYRERARLAIESMETEELHAVLRQAVLSLGPGRALDDVLTPLLLYIGERWHAGTLTPAHEHAASAVVRQLLGWLGAEYQPAPGAGNPNLVVATPSGDRHEFGAMLVAVTAATEGWRVTYLGADLPAADVVRTARTKNAAAVAISSIMPLDGVLEQLRTIRDGLPDQARLVVGGAGLTGQERTLARAGITCLGDMTALRSELRKLAETHP